MATSSSLVVKNGLIVTGSAGTSVAVVSSTGLAITGTLSASSNAGIGRVVSASTGLIVRGLGTTSATRGLVVENSSGTELLVQTDEGNLGVGTSSPVYQTQIYGSGQTTANLTDAGNKGGSLLLNTPTVTAGDGGALLFGAGGAGAKPFSAIKGLLVDGAGNTTGALAFSTRNATADTALTERMRLDSSGNLGLGVTPSAFGSTYKAFQPTGYAAYVGDGNNGRAEILNNAYASANNVFNYYDTNSAGRYSLQLGAHYWYGAGSGSANAAISWGDPKMSLDSSGNLGIGTSSPAYPLDVYGSGGASMAVGAATGKIFLYADNSATTLGALTAIPMRFYINGSELMRLDSSGNLGLGVTPAAWATIVPVLQVENASFSGYNNQALVGSNFYYNAMNRYIANGYATLYNQSLGQHIWYNAPNNTSGAGAAATFTQAMTLNASGNLGIGTSSPSGFSGTTFGDSILDVKGVIQVRGDATNGIAILSFGGDTYRKASIYTSVGTDAPYLAFSVASSGTSSNAVDRMTLDSSGNLGLGVTPSAWSSASRPALQLPNGAALFTRSGSTFLSQNFFYNSSDTGSFIANGFATTYYQEGGKHIWFNSANNTSGAGAVASLIQEMTLDASGNLGIGTTSPAAKLDVNGGALIQGLTVGRGAGAVSTNTAVGASALAANSSGTTNTAVGQAALFTNSTGVQNTASGANALQNNSSGSTNVAIGQGAMFTSTTASDNTAIGTSALFFNTTGASNTALGRQALFSNNIGANNTAVGYQAAYANTTTGPVTALGYQAAYTNNGGTDVTAVGWKALFSNTIGYNNNAFGTEALYGNTTGLWNSAYGHGSLYTNTTGSYNVALGALALRFNTTASNNTAVGYQAGYTNTTGEITAVGYQAAYSNVGGDRNTALGYQAMRGNTSGYYNTATGFQSMYTNTTGIYNVSNGQQALYNNTTGNNNTAIGTDSLKFNTTASNNTAVGYQAGYGNVTGTENFFGGYLAGQPATGSYLTFVGSRAGNASVTGSSNTAVGYYAYGSGSSGQYNTAIGQQALYLNTTASNNTAVGYQSLYTNQTTSQSLTAVGYQAGYTRNGGTEGFGSVYIGYRAAYGNTTGIDSVYIGGFSGNSSTGSYNTAIGSGSLYNNTTASNNTAVGYVAGYSNTTGALNTFIGRYSGYLNTTASNNTMIGASSGQNNSTGGSNTAIGADALINNTTASNNTAVGYQAGYGNTTGAGGVFLGQSAGRSNTTGADNNAIGSGAFYNNTTGNYNVALGGGALQANTTASNNTAVGYQAGYSNIVGTQNTFVGRSAGQSNTGSYNTAVGYTALYTNTTGEQNTAISREALYSCTTGSNNTAVGHASLYSLTTGTDNTGFGRASGSSITTGTNNTAIGQQALYLNTTASNNTAVGYQAAYANTTGTEITAIGGFALYANTTGTHNTSVGYASTQSNTTGNYNTALGRAALLNNTTASSNTAVGYQAGYANTTGQPNTAIGAGALVTNTTGANNVAVGGGLIGSTRGAMDLNTTGSQNTAIGVGSLSANTTASNNTAVGYQAGYSNITGAKNTYIGTQAGYSCTDIGDVHNTAIGYQAGYTMGAAYHNTLVGSGAGYNITTGNNNTFVGYDAGNDLDTGSFNTFIGRNAGAAITTGSKNVILGYYNGNAGGLDIRTASNYIVLSDGDGNPQGVFDSSGNFKLGGAPSAWNSVYRAFQVGAQGAFWANATAADIYMSANYLYDGANKYIANGYASFYSQINGAHIWKTAPNNTSGAGAPATFTQAMTLNASGELMLGTTTAFTKVSIAAANAATSIGSQYNPGILNIQNTSATNGNLSLIGFQDASAFINLAAIGAINTTHSASPGTVVGELGFYTKASGGSYVTERMRIDSSGNVILGYNIATSVSVIKTFATAHAAGNRGGEVRFGLDDGSFSGMVVPNVASSNPSYNSQYIQFYTHQGAVSAAERMRITADGNVGIGTTSPNGKLSLRGAFSTSQTAGLTIEGTGSTTGLLAPIGFYLQSSGWGTVHQATITAEQVSGSDGGANLILSTSTTGQFSPTERMRLDTTGNLLVGTTSASAPASGFVFLPNYSETDAAGIYIGHKSGSASGDTYAAFAYASSAIGSITQSGTTAVLYNTTSDQRLKENIQNSASASALIDSLQVRQYNWKSDGSHQRYGFVAQELVTVAPEAVYQPANPEEMMAVDYSKLVPMLVKEIQDLRKRLATLEAK